MSKESAKPIRRVSRDDEPVVVEVPGPDPVVIETREARVVLEPGVDYVIVAKERYARLAADLAAFRDMEKRALQVLSRRAGRRRARDVRP